MHILLVNDDGIHSPGLRELARALSEKHRVTVAAPDRERSAVGHGITLRMPLFVQEVSLAEGVKAYSVSGTPADCTRLGLDALAESPVDLVVSGPNRGFNLSLDALYSGTVSAALEAAMQGVKAVAVSAPGDADEREVVKVFLRILDQLDLERDLREMLNVNIPALPLEEIGGVCWAAQDTSPQWKDHYEQRVSPSGQAYYWLQSSDSVPDPSGDTDLSCMARGCVTLTPLTFCLTDRRGFREKTITL